jgi:hypothetical protein
MVRPSHAHLEGET